MGEFQVILTISAKESSRISCDVFYEKRKTSNFF